MKNKKVIIILTLLIILIGGGLFTNQMYNKSKDKHIPKRNNLAIMIKNESGEYVSSDAIPKGNYVLNEEKTICENGGKVVSYNSSTGQIGFSFLGSDRCSLYFDKIVDIEKPVISNLVINGATVTATLTDNQGLSGYGFSTSNSVEPSSWTSISGTSYNLSTTITTEGTYYLWVKDSADNKTVSDVIDLEKKGYQTILINNGGGATTVDAAINYIKGKGTPNFANTATTNEGMYAAEDDLGTSYYFRGAVNNNWVKYGKYEKDTYYTYDSNYQSYIFVESCNKNSQCYKIASKDDDMYWRIIRINGDGSIRMIYSGTTAPTSSTETVMTGTGIRINTGDFNNPYENPSYVGFMYTVGEQHGNSTSSTVKITMDNWYAFTMLNYDNLIAEQIFCNDRSATTSTSGTPGEINGSMTESLYYYGAYVRLNTNKNPILICPTEIDKFTAKSSNIGNKLLDYPIGLITADEIAMAGGVYDKTNYNFYLFTGQDYWSGTPFSFFDDAGCTMEFIVSSLGKFVGSYVSNREDVRPVISLSKDVKLSGDGTYNNVYTVS